MRVGTFASVVLTIAVLGCSKSEPPAPPPVVPPPAPASGAAAAKPPRPTVDPAKAAAPKASPAAPLPTIIVHSPSGVNDPRRAETPCDRHEEGWKWVGHVVDNGNCVVGPCSCEKG